MGLFVLHKQHAKSITWIFNGNPVFCLHIKLNAQGDSIITFPGFDELKLKLSHLDAQISQLAIFSKF